MSFMIATADHAYFNTSLFVKDSIPWGVDPYDTPMENSLSFLLHVPGPPDV